MGMTITDFWKLFLYGVKRDHYDQFIEIRGFLEGIPVDCFNIKFTTDSGDQEKKIPSLDDIDKKSLCIPIRDSTIPVLLLAIPRSAQYWIT